jgi:hypothetical protein
MLPAEHGQAVGVIEEQRRLHHLVEPAVGVVVDPLASLLDDDVALGQELGIAEAEVRHAVGFEGHHRGEMLGRDGLVEGGIVLGGEGIVLAAHQRYTVRELARRRVWRALEHQVLEEMGDARFADRRVGPAGLIDQHLHDHRRAVVLDDHNLEPVIEGGAPGAEQAAIGGAGREPGRRKRRQRGERTEDGKPHLGLRFVPEYPHPDPLSLRSAGERALRRVPRVPSPALGGGRGRGPLRSNGKVRLWRHASPEIFGGRLWPAS